MLTNSHMELNSDQAFAYGALAGNVKLVTGYPGSPSSRTIEYLARVGKKSGIYIEWCSNERVALEMAIGASIVGKRALVCVKSVGMNVMLDPMMALNLTPLNGGLVILLGDDPGGYGSQNEQDTRLLAPMLEMPLMEPASPAEAYQMMADAFSLSEKYHIPVIIRETRSFSQQAEPVEISIKLNKKPDFEYKRESLRFVPVPKNVQQKHKNLHQRLADFEDWANRSPFNRIIGNGKTGIVAAGFTFKKLFDLFGGQIPPELSLLKLSTLFPLPEKMIVDFLGGCQNILVLEENEPFVEIGLKSIAQEHRYTGTIAGKRTGHLPREGELFRWQIQQALSSFLPDFTSEKVYLPEDEEKEKPYKESHCGDCRYDQVLTLLEEAAEGLGQKLVVVGDPGCLVTVANRLDAKYAIGSAVAVADGISNASSGLKPVALIGDSGFFHSTIPAICNAVHNNSSLLLVVLDNHSALTSGGQPHPGVNKNILGEPAPGLNIQKISHACGIESVGTVSLSASDVELKYRFSQAMLQKKISMLIVEIPNTQ
ncbi:MAG TPA: hypothetical protein ENH29_10680 [Bacteroidetes bacterium]|nr:hypothetical protein [Bacteroidota bacterium]